MAEYIKREDVKGLINNNFGGLLAMIDSIPAADVAPVVHGRWKASSVLLECQNCGEIYSRLGGNGGKAWNYCPNCGARMDGAKCH